jgi:WD40 repeat protein
VQRHDQRDAIYYADDEQYRAMINEVLDTKTQVLHKQKQWLKNQSHVILSAKSMVSEVESQLSDLVQSCGQQSVDFADEIMGKCRQVVKSLEGKDAKDFEDDKLMGEVSIIQEHARKMMSGITLMKSSKMKGDRAAYLCHNGFNGRNLYSSVTSVAFHPTAALLAIGSGYTCRKDTGQVETDIVAKLWCVSPDGSTVNCVSTLSGHSGTVWSVAFHPKVHLMATGSGDKTAKLWRFSPDGSTVTCAATLGGVFSGHSGGVRSVAFHSTAPLLATGSDDETAKLWRLSTDNSSATCVATLAGHSEMSEGVFSNVVWSVAFHPTALLVATGSQDCTVKLWRLSSDYSSVTCVATLTYPQGHTDRVYSVAFHPTAPLLATGSCDKTVKLWLLSSNNSSATCVATLREHSSSVNSVAFHPTAPLLVTASDDATAKLWRFSPDGSTATCVVTLSGDSGGVRSVAFHPTAPLLATDYYLWR